MQAKTYFTRRKFIVQLLTIGLAARAGLKAKAKKSGETESEFYNEIPTPYPDPASTAIAVLA